MTNAPPVVYPVGRSLLGAVARALLLPVSLWLWQPWQATSLHGLTGLGAGVLQILLFGLVLAVILKKPGALKALHWDGEVWHAERADGRMTPVKLRVHADGGRFIWLSVRTLPGLMQARQATDPTWWLLLQARANPVRWHGFRCAVYCRSHTLNPQPQAQVRSST